MKVKLWIICALVFTGVAVGTASIGAADDYYGTPSDESSNVTEWLDERETASLTNVTAILSRMSTYLIGDIGESGQRALLTMLLIFGVLIGTVSQGRLGVVGGATLAVGSVAGLALAGLVPMWLYGMLFLGIAIVIGALIIRTLQ